MPDAYPHDGPQARPGALTTDHPLAPALTAARGGEERAWSTIYRALAPVVLGYLRGLRAREPEDLAGEVFVQVVRDLHRFEGGGAEFRAWVLTIAHHRFLDERRRLGRRPCDAVAEVPEPEVRGSARQTEEEAFMELARERVTELIGRLSPDQRAVLLLRILGDFTIEEVSRVVGKRPGAVKALQRRALASLERELAVEGVPLCAAPTLASTT